MPVNNGWDATLPASRTPMPSPRSTRMGENLTSIARPLDYPGPAVVDKRRDTPWDGQSQDASTRLMHTHPTNTHPASSTHATRRYFAGAHARDWQDGVCPHQSHRGATTKKRRKDASKTGGRGRRWQEKKVRGRIVQLQHHVRTTTTSYWQHVKLTRNMTKTEFMLIGSRHRVPDICN